MSFIIYTLSYHTRGGKSRVLFKMHARLKFYAPKKYYGAVLTLQKYYGIIE